MCMLAWLYCSAVDRINTHDTVHNSYRRAGKERRGGAFELYRCTFQCCLACCKSHLPFVVWMKKVNNLFVQRCSFDLPSSLFKYWRGSLSDLSQSPMPNAELWLSMLVCFRHLPRAWHCRSVYSLAPHTLNTKKEEQISSLNTSALSEGTGGCRRISQTTWVASCPWLHSCFLISGVINTETRISMMHPSL